MSIESTIYTQQPALSVAQMTEIGHRGGLELRAYDPEDAAFSAAGDADAPLYERGYVLIGWPRSDPETTAAVDGAMQRGEKAAVDQLGRAGKLGWLDLSCERFDYEETWEDCPEEREDFEESFPPEDLDSIRRAKTRYFLRCGTRPPQNGKLLGEVAELIRDATEGFLDEG